MKKMLKKIDLKDDSKNASVLSGHIIQIGITSYGFTPLKIGNTLEFALGKAHDFYLDGYSIKGEHCKDIYRVCPEKVLCLVQAPGGILAHYFSDSTTLSDDEIYKITLKTGKMILNDLEIGLYLNLVHRLNKEIKK